MKNLFSERHGYKRKKGQKPKKLTKSLKTRIYNFIEECLDSPESYEMCYKDKFGRLVKIKKGLNGNKLIEILWDEFFKKDLRILKEKYGMKVRVIGVDDYYYNIGAIRDQFYGLRPWYKVYDFIEFMLMRFNPNDYFISSLNEIFEKEGSPYRIIGKYITTLTSEVEVNELEQALNVSDKYETVRTHILNALEHFSRKPNPDYKNSIKESILSLEALVKIILNKPNGTLGELVDKLSIHSALKEALKKLYGWTSDEDGIRHAKPGEKTTSSEEEARFLLVVSSAIINYIIYKYEKQLTKEN